MRKLLVFVFLVCCSLYSTIQASAQNITANAGMGTTGYNAVATSSQLHTPCGVAVNALLGACQSDKLFTES